jgi:hypothetical protein
MDKISFHGRPRSGRIYQLSLDIVDYETNCPHFFLDLHRDYRGFPGSDFPCPVRRVGPVQPLEALGECGSGPPVLPTGP